MIVVFNIIIIIFNVFLEVRKFKIRIHKKQQAMKFISQNIFEFCSKNRTLSGQMIVKRISLHLQIALLQIKTTWIAVQLMVQKV